MLHTGGLDCFTRLTFTGPIGIKGRLREVSVLAGRPGSPAALVPVQYEVNFTEVMSSGGGAAHLT